MQEGKKDWIKNAIWKEFEVKSKGDKKPTAKN